jgi:hypothetical protein
MYMRIVFKPGDMLIPHILIGEFPAVAGGVELDVHVTLLDHVADWRSNYFHCPTCGYRYRMSRMSISRYISSAFAQVFLTIAVMIAVIFLLGFIADPIINFYLDPWSFFWPFGTSDAIPGDAYARMVRDEAPPGWGEHFFKGTASMGVLGFIKVMLASPFQFIRLGGGGRRGGRTGRDRANDVNMVVILIGVLTFSYVSGSSHSSWGIADQQLGCLERCSSMGASDP